MDVVSIGVEQPDIPAQIQKIAHPQRMFQIGMEEHCMSKPVTGKPEGGIQEGNVIMRETLEAGQRESAGEIIP